MAVAFSTGGSGYMRSDFMISDAAIPQRMEELSADQSDKFSQVLSGFSGKNDVPVDAAKTVERFTGSDGKVDMHALAKAVADGEVKLEDIPTELLTQELFTELTKLVEVPEKEDGEPTKEAAQEAMSELAALFTAQQTVQPEQVSDKSGELNELSQPVEAAQPTQPEQAQTVQAQPEQAAQPQESQDAGEIQTVQSFQTAQPEQPVREQTAPKAQEPQPTEMTAAQPQEQPAVPTQETPQQDSNGTELSGQTAAVQQPVSEEPQRSDVTEFTVRTAEPQQKQPEEPQQEAPVFTEHSTQRSRVVSKSDELEMIRGTADGAKSDSAAQTQAAPQEAPVVFTRADGTELEVRPAEVVKQVADRLIEKASDLKEGETEYTVTLEPQDLGKITVRMVKTADGAVSVSIAAENSKTLRIIEENGAHIQDSLKQNGVQLENWQTVSESQQEMHAEDYRGSSKNPYRESEGDKQEDDSGDKSFAELIASM